MNTLAYQVASLLNYDLTIKDDHPILSLKLFVHLVWSAVVYAHQFRLKVKVYDLDLGEYLQTIVKQFQVIGNTLDWYLGGFLPVKPYMPYAP